MAVHPSGATDSAVAVVAYGVGLSQFEIAWPKNVERLANGWGWMGWIYRRNTIDALNPPSHHHQGISYHRKLAEVIQYRPNSS